MIVIKWPGRPERAIIDPHDIVYAYEVTPENPNEPNGIQLLFRNGTNLFLRDDDHQIVDAILNHRKFGAGAMSEMDRDDDDDDDSN